MKPASLSAELRASNKTAYRVFLSHTVLRAALCALLLCLVPHLRAETSLPVAPVPAHTFTAVDWSLSATLYATHVADYLTTESCVHGTRCREVVLPQFLVHRSGLFAAYEFSTASLEVYGAYKLNKMGHRRLARLAQVVNISYTSKIVAHNCEVSWRTPATRSAR
jgi:hypothetical protein